MCRVSQADIVWAADQLGGRKSCQLIRPDNLIITIRYYMHDLIAILGPRVGFITQLGAQEINFSELKYNVMWCVEILYTLTIQIFEFNI